MVSNIDNFKTGVFDWFDSVTGDIDIKWANTVEQVELPYGVLQVISTRDLANATRRIINNEIIITWHRIMTVSCDLYGVGSFDLMHKVQASLNNPYIQDRLDLFDLAYVDNSNIQDLTFFQNTDFIERAQMDVMFGFNYTITTVLESTIESVDLEGVITTAEIEGTIDDINVDFNIVT